MHSTSSLPLLPDSLGPEVVAPDKVLYMGQINRLIGLVGRVFVNGPGDLGSITGRVIPKT